MKDESEHSETAFIGLLSFLFVSLFLISLSYVLGIPLFKSLNGTSLSSGELLVVAGITVTYYSLFEQVIIKHHERANGNPGIRGLLRVVVIANILIVSISIIYILISTINSVYFKNMGFNILILSWIANLALIITLFMSPIIDNLANKWKYRNKIIVIMLFVSITMLIYIIAS